METSGDAIDDGLGHPRKVGHRIPTGLVFGATGVRACPIGETIDRFRHLVSYVRVRFDVRSYTIADDHSRRVSFRSQINI